jgi:hypothetical protein
MKLEMRKDRRVRSHESPGSGPDGATEKPVLQYVALKKRRMQGMDMREINRRALRGVVWVGKAALFCFGLLAMLALVDVMTALTAVVLMATTLPATAPGHKRELAPTRASIVATRTALSQGQLRPFV